MGALNSTKTVYHALSHTALLAKSEICRNYDYRAVCQRFVNFRELCPSISDNLVYLAARSLLELTGLTTYHNDEPVLFWECTPEVGSSQVHRALTSWLLTSLNTSNVVKHSQTFVCASPTNDETLLVRYWYNLTEAILPKSRYFFRLFLNKSLLVEIFEVLTRCWIGTWELNLLNAIASHFEERIKH